MTMRRRQMLGHTLAWGCGCLAGCRSAPYTGRSQLMLIPESQEMALGEDAYQEVLRTESLSKNGAWQTLVQRTGERIAAVSGRTDYHWQFQLLASEQQNAFCLPGGKVAVYEGIMPICQNEAGLAVVMSHEVAHALARHGGERMSQQAGVQTMSGVLGYAMKGYSPVTRDLVMRAYGAGTQYGYVLPHSRKHELEADRIGIQLMAQAGYDPSEAPRFWKRFGELNTEKPAEWSSTHPSDQRRAEELSELLPEADLAYQSAPQRWGIGESV